MHGFADVFIGKAANGDFTLVPGSTTVERRTGVDHGRSGNMPGKASDRCHGNMYDCKSQVFGDVLEMSQLWYRSSCNQGDFRRLHDPITEHCCHGDSAKSKHGDSSRSVG